MRTYKYLIPLLFFCFIASFSHSYAYAEEHTSSKQLAIQVDGLSCPFCAYGLEKNLKKVKGVSEVEVDMKTGKAFVTIISEAKVTHAQLKEAVKRAGFSAKEITAVKKK